ncbi:hypothetical protein niasHT_009565 [Heterodera trifolii]|uniref:Uncharacterized protein n=1 Tax=Heterodera trifolii TaxID=157864 RepID=A0ABD2M5V1_9BILA
MEILRKTCKNFSIGEECDVREELKKNKEMKKFFESVPDRRPTNPRDAYAGDTPYPVGVPKIVVSRNFNVNWTVPDDVPYDGLLKVKVIPPKNLLYPLLPMHIDDMLLFPNCWACAKRAKNEFVMTKDEIYSGHRSSAKCHNGCISRPRNAHPFARHSHSQLHAFPLPPLACAYATFLLLWDVILPCILAYLINPVRVTFMSLDPTFEDPTFEDTTFEDPTFEDTTFEDIHNFKKNK